MDTSNVILQQILLSNRTLLIITTTMVTRIEINIATCGGHLVWCGRREGVGVGVGVWCVCV